MSDGLASLATAFDNNAAFQSLKSLSAFFPQYAAVAALRARLPDVAVRGPGVALPRAGARRAAVPISRAPRDVQALFPADVLGKTLTWDVTTDQYTISNLSGAPSNGIRVQLYAINPVTGQPIEPLQQLGYVDLTDESTAQSDKLGVLLKLGATTVADYDVAATVSTSSLRLDANGYVRSPDGLRQVTFDLTTSTSA